MAKNDILQAVKTRRYKKMRCPYCGSENSRVVDSRPAEDNNAIRRRRQCDECGKRFTTYEKIETEVFKNTNLSKCLVNKKTLQVETGV